MRVAELFKTIPQFMRTIVIIAILGSSIRAVITSLGIVSWPTVPRLLRSSFWCCANGPLSKAAS